MTDLELINMHKTLLGESEVVALRAIYNAGYCAGAGATPSVTAPDYSVQQTKPSDDTIQVLKKQAAIKH